MKIQIMWKEIAIIFLVLLLLRLAFDMYISVRYKQIMNGLYVCKFKGLEQKIKRLKKMCCFAMALPIPKKAFFAYNLMYNNLCNMAASMALLEGNEEEFLFHLSAVARENDYEVKPFMLSLYHLSKGHNETAARFYEHYLQCRQENQHIKVIMTHLFATSGTEVGSDALYESAAQFKNPAVIKLLGHLGIWGDQIH